MATRRCTCGTVTAVGDIHTCSPQVTRPRVEGEALTDAEMVQLLTAELAAEREKRHAAKMARKSARDEANASTRKWIVAATENQLLTAEVERLKKADQFWLAASPEDSCVDELQEMVWSHDLEHGRVTEVWTGKRLPSVWIVPVFTGDDGDLEDIHEFATEAEAEAFAAALSLPTPAPEAQR